VAAGDQIHDLPCKPCGGYTKWWPTEEFLLYMCHVDPFPGCPSPDMDIKQKGH